MSPALYMFAADVKEISFTMDQIEAWRWLVALLPIVTVLVLMLGAKFSGGKSGACSWIVALIIGATCFGADFRILTMGTVKGIWTTFFVLYIIWTAMAMYNIVDMAHGFKIISNQIIRWTAGNKMIQLLTLGWAFPSFIQGVCGFGVPCAVGAPILVGIGFDPIFAAATALLGHSWSVTFGSLGSSYSVLVTFSPDLDPDVIAQWTSYSIMLACWLMGASIVHMYAGFKGFKQGWRVYALIALGMSGTTWIFANFITPYVASFVAGMVGIILGAVVAPKLGYYKKLASSGGLSPEEMAALEAAKPDPTYGFNKAFSGYYFLIGVVFIIYLTPLKGYLNGLVKLGLPFPAMQTGLGYNINEEEKYSSIKILTAPGTCIILASVCAYIFYHIVGKFEGGFGTLLKRTYKQAIGSTVTVLTMSMMAVVMVDTGMTEYLAVGFAKYTGKYFAIISPTIGNLGAFMTGSNTNSNILFCSLQRTTATVLGMSPYIILGLQSTGGAIGNCWCPMNVALGTGVTGTGGREGEVMSKTILYGILMPIIVGLFGFLLYSVVPGMM